MPDMIPKLRRYQLLDLIGCGGMGQVYIGYQVDTEKIVAIKILSQECALIPAVLQRFKIEGDILRRLRHQNVVPFVEAGEDGGFHYLVMEYVKGMSLEAFPLGHSPTTLGIKQTLPTIEEYLVVFMGCLGALDYIHKQGLVHRDIKPSNIILQGAEYKPILIDFGIAKKVKDEDDLNMTGERLYTLAYASPEQLMSKPLDTTSDLFSFGVVMYEKLTGYLPFPGKREMEVFLAITKWNFPSLRQISPDVPQKLEQIVLKLLAKDPAQRYPSAAMVWGELERLLVVVRQAGQGLVMSGIHDEIRDQTARRRGFKKRTLADEKLILRKARAEFVEAKNQLRVATMRTPADPLHIEQLKMLCETLQEKFDLIQEQMKMAMGFKSQPLVIDRFNSIFKLETVAFEKRGIPFTINIIEQKLASPEGADIIVGALNFTQRAKRVFSINRKDTFIAWDQSNRFFNSYEEKDFPIFVMVGDPEMPHPPEGFKGFFWPFEFLVAVYKLGWTGVAIIESFSGVDRNGHAVQAQHKETILFSNSLLDEVQQRVAGAAAV